MKPSTIYFSGDGGNVVTGLTWTQWSATGAVGQGTWGYDDCNPNCASGTVTRYPATVTLSGVSGGQFTDGVERTSGPHGFTQPFSLPNQFFEAAS